MFISFSLFIFYGFQIDNIIAKKDLEKNGLLISLSSSLLFLHSLTLPFPAHLSLLFPASTASLHILSLSFIFFYKSF